MNNFEELVGKFERLVYTVCFRIMGSEEDAKDVTQEVFLKLYQSLNNGTLKIENDKATAGWLCRVANNRCVDELRKRRLIVISTDELAGSDEWLGQDRETPEKEVLKKESAAGIEEAIQSLSPEHKAAIVLRDIQGYSYEEISKMTKTTMGTVKSRVSRARENLKKFLRGRMEQNDT